MLGEKLLDYLNDTYTSLHKKYEDLYWISYMGDHTVDEEMNLAQKARDAFRADHKLKDEVEKELKMAHGKVKSRLFIWKHFFELYQTPPEALIIKEKIARVEGKIMQIRAKRKEGYFDPISKKFVEASQHEMITIMRTNADERIRKACFQSLEKLPLDTIDLYIEVIKLRNEFAKMVGYKDFYDYKVNFDDKMSKRELFSIFNSIYKKTKYAFKNVKKFEKEKPGLQKPWNFGYMMTGSFVKEEDQYFHFKNVLEYWGRSFAALGINFQRGKLTLDLLDRKGKYNNGFCHYPDLVRFKNGKRIPGSSNFTSNAVPRQIGSGIGGLHTVFHEAGHAADRLNSQQEDVCVNTEYPPETVSWAETHSMFMDLISDSIEWRTRYAKNDKGDFYPFDIFERKLKVVFPLRPLDMMYVMFVIFFEKEIYECKNLTKNFVLKTAKKVYRKYIGRSEDSIGVLNIPHIYNWDSSAYYHGYGLAELGVHQWREYFFKKYGYIVDNPKVGKEMTKIWSYASIYPASKLIKMATGKKLGPDTYIRNITKPLNEIIETAKKRIKRLQKVPMYNKAIKLNATISIVHGKKKIADNKRSFEDMNLKYKRWIQSQK